MDVKLKSNIEKSADFGKEEKLAQLERILQSHTMHGSENLKSFLRYIALKAINESTDQLKEYTIATEVFGRSDDFSPRSDSVVRVQAKRLRSKLREYYATEGKSDRILIDLPKGHYYPVFLPLEAPDSSDPGLETLQQGYEAQAQAAPQPAAEPAAPSLPNRKLVVALSAVIALLLVAVAWLVMSNSSLRQQFREISSEGGIERFGPVWQPFLQNSDRTLLVLSNPAVYRFTNPIDADVLLKNSVTLSSDQARHVNETVGDKFMIKHSGGRLILSTDQYTGMGEAIGLARITNLFRSAGRGALLKQSRTVSPEDLKNHDVILLGSMWVNEWSGKLPIKEDFSYSPSATIQNHNQQPGEEAEYAPKFDSAGRLIEDYGLITVKPNISYRNTVMVIAGIYSQGTEAAAEYVTNPDYLKNLNDRLLQSSEGSAPPKYYQALLKVAVDNGIPTTISLISVHTLKAQGD